MCVVCEHASMCARVPGLLKKIIFSSQSESHIHCKVMKQLPGNEEI